MILAASLKLIDELGVNNVTMGRIAAATSLSRPAIYQYFSSRENILGELLINDMADLSNEIDRIVSLSDVPMEQIRLWIHYALAHMASPEHRVVRQVSRDYLDDEHRGELREMHRYFMNSLISPLRTLGVQDPSALVSLVFAAIGSASDRIDEGNDFVAEAATLERFVTAGIEAILENKPHLS